MSKEFQVVMFLLWMFREAVYPRHNNWIVPSLYAHGRSLYTLCFVFCFFVVMNILVNYDSASSPSVVSRLYGMIYFIAPKLDVGLLGEVCFRYETHIYFFCVKDCLQFLLMLQEPIGIPRLNSECCSFLLYSVFQFPDAFVKCGEERFLLNQFI